MDAWKPKVVAHDYEHVINIPRGDDVLKKFRLADAVSQEFLFIQRTPGCAIAQSQIGEILEFLETAAVDISSYWNGRDSINVAIFHKAQDGVILIDNYMRGFCICETKIHVLKFDTWIHSEFVEMMQFNEHHEAPIGHYIEYILTICNGYAKIITEWKTAAINSFIDGATAWAICDTNEFMAPWKAAAICKLKQLINTPFTTTLVDYIDIGADVSKFKIGDAINAMNMKITFKMPLNCNISIAKYRASLSKSNQKILDYTAQNCKKYELLRAIYDNDKNAVVNTKVTKSGKKIVRRKFDVTAIEMAADKMLHLLLTGDYDKFSTVL